MKVLTIKEAVEMVNNGNNLEGVVLDESTVQQVNVRDAMVLARGGIVIPEQNIYYNDDDIEYDEDIDELVITSGVINLSWEEKAMRAKEYKEKGAKEKAITTEDFENEKLVRVLRAEVAVDKEIADWISHENVNVNQLLTNLMKDFYRNAKATSTLADNKIPRTLHG
jgi:hypothetical protein